MLAETKLEDWKSNFQSFFNARPLVKKGFLVALGGFMTLAYSPFDIWPIALICLAKLAYFLSSEKTAKDAAWTGFYFGLGWFGTGISWVHVAIADFGGLPLILSLLLMLVLVAYLALFPALAGYLNHKWNKFLGPFALVPAWLLAESLRGWMLSGFPWLSIGYSQLQGPLAGFAPVLGEFGIQIIVLLLVSASLYKYKSGLITLLTIAVSAFLLQQVTWYKNKTESVQLALVQGNIEQSIKWQPDNELPTMQKYLALTTPYFEKSDLIIWPEAAIPRLEILANDFLVEMDMLAASSDSAIVTGLVDYQPETNFAYNNLVVLGKKRSQDQYGHYKYLGTNRYAKHHLLPIGEYVPFESVLRKLAPIFDLPMSSFSRGTYQQNNLIANDINLSPAICFEIAFPEQIRANLYPDSQFILTVSNDAWFGDSHGPWQHLQIAQMRALEFAMPVIRATNNGVTAVVDSSGNIVAQLPQNTADVLEHELQLVESATPYKRFGNAITWILLVILTGLALWRNKRS